MPECFVGVDFGTSNSTVGVSRNGLGGARLIPLEADQLTLPSAMFFPFDDSGARFGRAAIEAYVGGEPGRLMRALKSVLGSALLYEKTRLGRRSMSFVEILGAFFEFIRRRAETQLAEPIDRAVFGRPVRFVDDDDAADAAAEAALADIARTAGFREIAFQYEPIAAALDYEQRVAQEETVLIVDIGGGTSDFSIVRVSPERAGKPDRRDDVLANAGVHVGGSDFDRWLSLSAVMPHFGFGARTLDGKRELPSRYFHDLATWQFINRLYSNKVMTELKHIRHEAARRDLIDRLVVLVEERRGHSLALAVERAKIDLTHKPEARLDLRPFHQPTAIAIERHVFDAAIDPGVQRVVGALREVLAQAELPPSAIGHVFVTGGSSSVPLLRMQIAAMFPQAQFVTGDLFGSVGVGLALDARRKFG